MNLPANEGDMGSIRKIELGQEDPLEEGMATHSSILAWKIPWIEEPGGLSSIWLGRVEHEWSNLACTHCSVTKWCPTLCNPMDCSMPGSCPPLSPRVCSKSCPLSWWCYLTILSCDVPFSFCLQSFPAPESFPVSWLFPSGGQSTGVSASAPIPPMNIQGWFLLGLTGLISLPLVRIN